MFFYDLPQVFRLGDTGLAPHDLTILEKDQCGNALDLVCGSYLGISVNIYFDDLGFVTNICF